MVCLLLEAGARIGPGLLQSAVKMSGYLTGQEISLLLLRHGAEVRDVDSEGRSALSWAVSLNNSEVVSELLRLGGDPASVSRMVLGSASEEVRRILQRSRNEGASLDLLAMRTIRRAVVLSDTRRGSFPSKLDLLPLPQRLIHSLND